MCSRNPVLHPTNRLSVNGADSILLVGHVEEVPATVLLIFFPDKEAYSLLSKFHVADSLSSVIWAILSWLNQLQP